MQATLGAQYALFSKMSRMRPGSAGEVEIDRGCGSGLTTAAHLELQLCELCLFTQDVQERLHLCSSVQPVSARAVQWCKTVNVEQQQTCWLDRPGTSSSESSSCKTSAAQTALSSSCRDV